MSDNADIAADLQEQHIKAALSSRDTSPKLKFTGYCHNCEESLKEGERFCDADCRDDFEQRQRMKHGTVKC
ncbi:DUF2116 family Zn-ribbon domain-containing protein [Shewanella sp. 202IG2-18]|uniref:DUF2116 family Zn-ribbon domain-containing protein n=1 Tax=Parashewanella hymeniacidonis TaxID=2807618 RepID=UPI00196094FF|nr:DUF2116 family Zn-ribbon domain-containing protein [Parashewanella hymeniacidonis]MBM7070901.1 DUF2116 family Zn-ribbon domain-containing protein [Parashewanella hymeniacidonis]